MSSLYVVIITLSAIGLYHAARMDGYLSGLKRREDLIRKEVEQRRERIILGLPDQIDEQGRRECWWDRGQGTGQKGSL